MQLPSQSKIKYEAQQASLGDPTRFCFKDPLRAKIIIKRNSQLVCLTAPSALKRQCLVPLSLSQNHARRRGSALSRARATCRAVALVCFLRNAAPLSLSPLGVCSGNLKGNYRRAPASLPPLSAPRAGSKRIMTWAPG